MIKFKNIFILAVSFCPPYECSLCLLLVRGNTIVSRGRILSHWNLGTILVFHFFQRRRQLTIMRSVSLAQKMLLIKKMPSGTGEMAQWIRLSAATPNALHSVLYNCTPKREKLLL